MNVYVPGSASTPIEFELTRNQHMKGAHGMVGNVDEMRKPELMKYAASLGVATRREGAKLWRVVDNVRADCKVREAAQ